MIRSTDVKNILSVLGSHLEMPIPMFPLQNTRRFGHNRELQIQFNELSLNFGNKFTYVHLLRI